MENRNSNIVVFVTQGWEKRIPITQALWGKTNILGYVLEGIPARFLHVFVTFWGSSFQALSLWRHFGSTLEAQASKRKCQGAAPSAIRSCLCMFRKGRPSSIWLHFDLHFGVVLGAKLVVILLFGGPWSQKGGDQKVVRQKVRD